MPKPQNRKVRSSCWYFYDKTTDGGICKICNKNVRSTGNTTNLLNHLKRRHPVEFRDNDSEYAEERYNDHENMSPTTANHHENEDATRVLQTHHSQAMEAYEAEQGTVIWLESTEPHGGTTYQPQITIVRHMENGEGEQAEGAPVGTAEGNAAPQHEGAVEENNGAEASPAKQTGERKTLQQIGKIVPSGRSRPNTRFQNSAPYNRPQGGSGAPATGTPAPHRFEDPFEAFGRYVASLLRNLNSKRGAYRLQKDIIWQILQEQMREC